MGHAGAACAFVWLRERESPPLQGLEDVERFDAIDASRNIKDFLGQQR